jgi:hypothetical protein
MFMTIIATLIIAVTQKSSFILILAFAVLLILSRFYKSSKLKLATKIFLGLFVVSVIFWAIVDRMSFCDSWIMPSKQESSCQCNGVKINYAEGGNIGALFGLAGNDWGNKCLGTRK